MSHGTNQTSPRDDCKDEGDPLKSAISHLRRGLRPDGTYESADEWEATGHQWRLLQGWCEDRGLIVSGAAEPAKSGGKEHDVTFMPELGRWLKFTKPNAAGYMVEVVDGRPMMLPATPLKYLERWSLSNRLFGDQVEFLGIQKATNGKRLVVSQPDVEAIGVVDWEALESYIHKIAIPLKFEGFLGGYGSRGYLMRRIGIFDVRPENCVLSISGHIIPIDFIVQVFSAIDTRCLRKLLLTE